MLGGLRASQYHHPMPNGSLTLLLFLSALAGCAEEKKRPNLELACQLAQCTCVSDSSGTATTAVLWTESGNAYCPEGFFLLRQSGSII